MNKQSDHPAAVSGRVFSSALFDHNPLPACVLETPSFKLTATNKAFLAFFGYAAGELSGLSFAKLLVPADRARLQNALAQHPPAKGWSDVFTVHTAAGRTATAELFWAPLPSAEEPLWQVMVVDLTDRQALINNLATDRERYKVYIEQSSEGIYCQTFINPPPFNVDVNSFVSLLQHDGAITECNMAMARMYGFDHPSNLIGALPGQLLDTSDPATIEYIQAFIDSGFNMVDAESHEKDRYGNSKYFLNNLVGIVENGYLKCVWGTQRDITDKKKTEAQIRLLASMVEQTSDVLTAADLDFKPISWNKAAEKIYGIKAVDALGHDLEEYLDFSYRDASVEEVRHLLQTKGEWRGEVYFTRPADGVGVALLMGFRLLRDENNKPLGYVISGTDISERKEGELKLRESERRFQEVAESAPVMITMCGVDEKITYANKRFLDFTGLDMEACATLEWRVLVCEEDIPIAIDKFDQSFAQRQPVTLVYRLRNAAGEFRWVQDTAVPRYLEDGSFIGYIGSIVDIHDTKSQEEQLRHQAAILEHVVDIIITTDFSYRILSLNKEAEQAFGVNEEEAIGKRLGEVVALNIISSTREEAERDFARDGIWKGEVSFVNGKGETRYLLQTVSYLCDAEDNRKAIMSVGRDITDRKLAQLQLNQSERFYRSLIADSLDGMILIDTGGNITFSSPSVKHILGYIPEEIQGTNAFGFVHPDDLAWAWNSFQREVNENPEVKFITIRLRKKSGDWVWCMVRGHNLLNNPYVKSLAIYFHDDTLRKKASDALKESEERFRQLVRNLQFGVAMQDAHGRVLMGNEALMRIFNLQEEELVGNFLSSTLSEALAEDGSPAHPHDMPLAVAIRSKKPVRNMVLGIFHPRMVERKWILVSSDPVLDENDNLVHVVCTITDITERKRLEQRLLSEQINQQRLLTQATIDGQEKERREIGKELHDNIGQQLTTTKLFLDLAKSTADDTTAEMISMALKGISDVINEVRQMSRSLMPPTLGDLGLMESVTDLTETISRTKYVRIDLDDYDFNEKRVPDNQQLMVYRIIQEQLNNIVKHAEARKVTVTLRNDKGCLHLEIKDDGKGFDPQTVRKGLGLTNMQNRAELFGGTLVINSAPGRGCTLTLRVPELQAGARSQ